MTWLGGFFHFLRPFHPNRKGSYVFQASIFSVVNASFRAGIQLTFHLFIIQVYRKYIFNRKYIFKWSMLHCYVRLPECKWLLWEKTTKTRDSQPSQNRENLTPTSDMTTSAYPPMRDIDSMSSMVYQQNFWSFYVIGDGHIKFLARVYHIYVYTYINIIK